MRKAKWLFSFVLIFIMLSFFNVVSYADDNTPHDDLSFSVRDGYIIQEIQTDAPDEEHSFSYMADVGSSVFHIESTSNNWSIYQKRDDGTIEYLTLAGRVEGQHDIDEEGLTARYELLNPQDQSNGGSDIYVILNPNTTYYVSSDSPTEFTITHTAETGYDGALDRTYVQTNISSTLRTNGEDAEEVHIDEAFDVGEHNVDDYVDKSGASDFQKLIVKILLTIGDYFVKLLNNIVGDDVTIANLVFNRVKAVNPNFYSDNKSGLAHLDIKSGITKWYNFFYRVAVIFYLFAILMIGLRVLINSTAKGIQDAKSLAVEWFKGVIYLLFMPFVIKFIFTINEVLVDKISSLATGTNNVYTVGSATTDGRAWSAEELEFRSPEYMSRHTNTMGYGSEEANDYYMANALDYAANFDLMHLARAYAGATYQLTFVFIWFILIGQLINFIYIYYKRYFMIAFFIGAFPIICIFQAIGIMKDGRSRAVSGWLGEIISNVFTQFIHCIIYVIITALVISIVWESTVGDTTNKTINWIIVICAINFVPEGEKILRNILKAVSKGSTTEGVGDGSLKKGFTGAMHGARRIGNAFRK